MSAAEQLGKAWAEIGLLRYAMPRRKRIKIQKRIGSMLRRVK